MQKDLIRRARNYERWLEVAGGGGGDKYVMIGLDEKKKPTKRWTRVVVN